MACIDYDPQGPFVRDPVHGGKVTCCVDMCGRFIHAESKYIHLKNSDKYLCEDCWTLQMNGLFK